jgi:hypothetical protein
VIDDADPIADWRSARYPGSPVFVFVDINRLALCGMANPPSTDARA